METSLQSLIDKHLKTENEKRNNRERSGKFIASNLGRCFRLQYWYRASESISDPIDERTLRIFEAGKFFHKFVQDILVKDFQAQSQAQIEVKAENENFICFADIVFPDEVVEMKSQHSKAFWYMAKAEKEGDFEIKKESNILQAVFCARMLGKAKARLIFISKDDLCVAEYIFYVEKWEEKLNNEIKTLMDFWVKKELPPAKPRAYASISKSGEITYRDCEYCSFKTKCEEKEKK